MCFNKEYTMDYLGTLISSIVNAVNEKRKKVEFYKSYYRDHDEFFYYHENFVINHKPYAIRVRGNNINIQYISITDPFMPYGRRTIKYVENISCKNKQEFMQILYNTIIKSIR